MSSSALVLILTIAVCSRSHVAGQGSRSHGNPNCTPGSNVILDFFGWEYANIAEECEHLGDQSGVCAIQISPPSEHMIVSGLTSNTTWYQRWRVVSFSVESTDAGSAFQFSTMIQTCNANKIQVFADVEFNHMTNEDANNSLGSAGSFFNSVTKEYPGYGANFMELDFHVTGDGCITESNNIEDFALPAQIRGCRLPHVHSNHFVHDLKTESPEVQAKIVTFLNRMVTEFGISGFRIAHARNVPPPDIEAIVNRLDTINGQVPFVYYDVLDFSENYEFSPIRNHEYSPLGRVEEVRGGERLTQIFRGSHNRSLADLANWPLDLEEPNESVFFIDDPYIVRNVHRRGMDAVSNHRDRREYEALNALLLSLPFTGVTRILSSYTWPRLMVGEDDINTVLPPPLSPPNLLPGGDGCDPGDYGLTCEHRWTSLRNMFVFNGLDNILLTNMTNFWTNGHQMAAFGRGNLAFVAINNGENTMEERLQTGLPAGVYCDLITGSGTECGEGSRSLEVDEEGYAEVVIEAFDDHPIMVVRKHVLRHQ